MLQDVQGRLSELGIVTVPAAMGHDDRHHPAVFGWSQITRTVPVSNSAPGLSALTGAVSRAFVVDIDPRNNGRETWEGLIQGRSFSHDGLQTLTAGGGIHYWFRIPDGVHVGKRTHGLGPGVDVLGDGAAPTVAGTRKDGSFYTIRWGGLPDPPPWLLEMAPNRASKGREAVSEPLENGSACEDTRRLAEALRQACEAGDRLQVLTVLRRLTRAAEDGHTGLRDVMHQAATWYIEGRRALSDRDGKVRNGIGEDYIRMCETVLRGANFDQERDDPCSAMDLLRSFGF